MPFRGRRLTARSPMPSAPTSLLAPTSPAPTTPPVTNYRAPPNRSQYGVSDKTAARAVQQLISEGLVLGRPGLRPVVVPRAQRPDRWPMHRRYARAREARGLVFGADMQGRAALKLNHLHRMT